MRIDVKTRGFVDILEVRGEPDADNSNVLGRRVRELVEAREPLLIVDLSRVRALASAWLGELVVCRERVRKQEGTIKVVARGPVKEVFVASALNRVFPLYDNADDALDSFDPECATAGVP